MLLVKNNERPLKIEYLEWDSVFFGLKIGRIFRLDDVNELPCLKDLLTHARKLNYQLIYLVSGRDIIIEPSMLKTLKIILVDKRVIFEEKTNQKSYNYFNVEEYKNSKSTSELDKLACLAGEYSRFRYDPNFKDSEYIKLYKEWMKNSTNKLIADKVYVIKNRGEIIAMLTIKRNSSQGTIGLISVDTANQGKGYGKQLIEAAKKYLYDHGLFNIRVATQLYNKDACAFYENSGFTIKSINNIYHIWL